ncbi:hypothetical protein HYN48_14200 [Flavobacterium magnum]|uniref:Uncharacterized protein n=2 Tax=Flavobacterium magnum TaxID=2162713 RepID=A0A2S0RJ42_9FLAO|nr:hypothetical protein HYN48_14200 [Flavobacterium magnum]
MNFSCSPVKQIEKKISTIDKQIKNKPFRMSFNFDDQLETKMFENENGITKMNIEVMFHRPFVIGKFQIYFENDISFFIAEKVEGDYTANSNDKKYHVSEDNKIYINNWETFDVKVVGSDRSYLDKTGYMKLIDNALKDITESEKK